MTHDTTRNTWMDNSSELAVAYARHNAGTLGMVRQRLLARALSVHMPSRPQRIIDIGGGEGHQAISLARGGHQVVVLDPDPAMLDAARRRLVGEERPVRDRVRLVLGYGENAAELVRDVFDVVCCHGILMYVPDPAALLASVVDLARPGGLISVLALNAEASAMRPALRGRWATALTALGTGRDDDDCYLPARSDTVEGIGTILTAAGAPPVAWYGVRVFSDRLPDDPPGPDFEELCQLEWMAGRRDPYRRVARLFHLVAQRAGG